MWHRRFASCALLATLSACGVEAGGGSWSGEVRDSAGVVLVTNPPVPSWAPDERWRVEEDLVIGGEEARPETLFGHVADVAVDEAGRIYVLDGHAQAVRVFEPQGTYVTTIGGPGEGPGELSRFAFSVLARADTLLVVDWGQNRITRYATDGAVLGSEPVPGSGAARSWWAATGSGLFFRSLERYTDGDARWRGRDALLRYAEPGVSDTVVHFAYEESDIGGPGAPNVPLIINAPSWAVLGDGRIAWLALAEGSLRIHGAGGRLERIVRSEAWSPRTPSDVEVQRMVEGLGDKLEMLGGSRESVSDVPVEAPEALPAVTSVVAGPDGTIWVQRMGAVELVHPMALNAPDPPHSFGGPVWDVLDSEGRFLGSIELPGRFRVTEVGPDAIHGVQWDALGVERVVRLRLVR